MAEVKYEYKGFKLGEKKAIREGEAEATKHVASVVAKLGAGWTVVWDWDSFNTNAPEDKRMTLGTILYTKHMPGLAAEIAKFDDELIEAINDACGADKVITWKMGTEGEDYANGDGSFRVDGFNGGVTITVGPRYGLGGSYMCDRVCASACAPFSHPLQKQLSSGQGSQGFHPRELLRAR